MDNLWNPNRDMPDLRGKIAVVTGANSGIGLETVKHLHRRGAKIYFTARSDSKAALTKEHILLQNPQLSSEVPVWLPMDLSDIGSILQAVESLKKMETKVDILINSAGMVSRQPEMTEAGWEMSIAVSYIGHFIFTNGLIPLLKVAAAQPGADVRVVNVSSNSSHVLFPRNYPFDFTSPSVLAGAMPYEPLKWRYLIRHIVTIDMMTYGLGKMAINLFTRELQRRCDERGLPIISTAIHPGSVRSGDDTLEIFAFFVRPFMKKIMTTADKGSYTTLFAATAKQVQDCPNFYKGQYMEPIGRVVVPHAVLENEEQPRGLWGMTTREINTYLVRKGYGALGEW